MHLFRSYFRLSLTIAAVGSAGAILVNLITSESVRSNLVDFILLCFLLAVCIGVTAYLQLVEARARQFRGRQALHSINKFLTNQEVVRSRLDRGIPKNKRDSAGVDVIVLGG